METVAVEEHVKTQGGPWTRARHRPDLSSCASVCVRRCCFATRNRRHMPRRDHLSSVFRTCALQARQAELPGPEILFRPPGFLKTQPGFPVLSGRGRGPRRACARLPRPPLCPQHRPPSSSTGCSLTVQGGLAARSHAVSAPLWLLQESPSRAGLTPSVPPRLCLPRCGPPAAVLPVVRPQASALPGLAHPFVPRAWHIVGTQ